MDVPLSPESEAQLGRLAMERGRDVRSFIQNVLEDYLAGEIRFVEAVLEGESSLARGEFVTLEALGENFERLFRS